MEERMTQEPREVSADEPQTRLDEAGEQIDAADEDRTAEHQATDKLASDTETQNGLEEDVELEDQAGAEANDADLETPEEEFEEDEPEPLDEDEESEETETDELAGDIEAQSSSEEDVEVKDQDAIEADDTEVETSEEEFEEDPPRSLDEDEELGETDSDDEEAEDSVEQDQDQAEEEPNQAGDAEGDTPTVESVIEAILFATDEPLTDGRLASIVETTGKQVRDCIKALNEKYETNHNAFRIEQIAGGYQMLTVSTYNTWLRKMLRVRSDNKLSPAALETLAIVAYKQPVIRVDVEAIRGVAAGEVLRSLMYKGLVKIVGRAEILGRPMLYGTTKKFLEVFGLNSLKDLPKVEELKKPD